MTHLKKLFPLIIVVLLLKPSQWVTAQDPEPTAEFPSVPTPAEVINAVNALRLAYGLPALAVHSVLMQVAQEEASGIAAGRGGHWRPDGITLGQWLILSGYPLSGDLSLDGYRSENWGAASSAQEAISMWLGDDLHTNTMLSVDRSDIGAGIAVSDQIYVVLETALQTRSGGMQGDAAVILTSIPMTRAAYFSAATEAAENGSISQYSLPVALSTPSSNGEIYHEVQYGQTLWSIAIAYDTTIKQIQLLNNMSDTTVITGQRLLVGKGVTPSVPLLTRVYTPAIGTTTYLLTPTAAVSPPPSPSTVFTYSEEDRQSNIYSVGAIGIAALVLGGLFTAMTRKGPV